MKISRISIFAIILVVIAVAIAGCSSTSPTIPVTGTTPVAIDTPGEFHTLGDHVFSPVILHIFVKCQIILTYERYWPLLVRNMGFDNGKEI